MIEAFKRRHDLVVNGLNEINGISCLPADGAFMPMPTLNLLFVLKVLNLAQNSLNGYWKKLVLQ